MTNDQAPTTNEDTLRDSPLKLGANCLQAWAAEHDWIAESYEAQRIFSRGLSERAEANQESALATRDLLRDRAAKLDELHNLLDTPAVLLAIPQPQRQRISELLHGDDG